MMVTCHPASPSATPFGALGSESIQVNLNGSAEILGLYRYACGSQGQNVLKPFILVYGLGVRG